MKILLIQVDSRPISHFNQSKNFDKHLHIFSCDIDEVINNWDYFSIVSLYNRTIASEMSWHYSFKHVKREETRHPIWTKIRGLLDYYNEFKKYDIVLYLDSDAIVRDPFKMLNHLAELRESIAECLFGTDPPSFNSTYINAGVLAFKPSDFFRNILTSTYHFEEAHPYLVPYYHKWPQDQKVFDTILKEFDQTKIKYLSWEESSVDTIRHIFPKDKVVPMVVDEILCYLSRKLTGTKES